MTIDANLIVGAQIGFGVGAFVGAIFGGLIAWLKSR